MANETIAAISTPPGRGGIGVIRISGASLAGMLQALTGRQVKPRRATRTDFRDSQDALIDQGLVLYFPQPQSYTGEDVIELQAHGGAMVLQLLLQRCVELGARLAEPGEFTKRAFLNGKLDLAQAESVADLIDASTAAAARCAARSLQGDFSLRIEALVQALVGLRTLVEATLDFPEDNIDLLEHHGVLAKLDGIREQLAQVLAGARQGSILRSGLQAVIAGQPNVGKSSLLNRLAGEEVAIVTEIPGTTRDAIRQSVSIDGIPLHVIDTAGLRESSDAVETIGISRAWSEIARADLVLWVADATRPETSIVSPHLPSGVPVIHILNKTDIRSSVIPTEGYIAISAKTGQGMLELKQVILARVGWGNTGDGVYMARERQLQALRAAQKALEQAPDFAFPELVAEHLKFAQRELSTITGEFTAEDLLGQIFARFCIGK